MFVILLKSKSLNLFICKNPVPISFHFTAKILVKHRCFYNLEKLEKVQDGCEFCGIVLCILLKSYLESQSFPWNSDERVKHWAHTLICAKSEMETPACLQKRLHYMNRNFWNQLARKSVADRKDWSSGGKKIENRGRGKKNMEENVRNRGGDQRKPNSFIMD